MAPPHWPAGRRYGVILADPPWQYAHTTAQGAAARHYATLSDADLAALPVAQLAADPCALLLWATGPKLDVAVDTMRRWGFTYKTVFFTWVKTLDGTRPVFGLGHYTRSCTELCLLGVRGRTAARMRRSRRVAQLITAARREHSRKPAEARARVDEFFGAHVRKLELCAREHAPRWDAWGDDVGRFDVAADGSTA
jgi:N6-adenosine-specific RNA methylase IME4